MPTTPETVEKARAEAAQQYGSLLAQKSSDAFCLAITAPSRVGPVSEMLLASPAASRPLVRPVLEFGGSTTSAAEPQVTTGALEAVREAMETVAETLPAAEKSLTLLIRQAAVKEARDDFYRSVGGVRDEIERATSAVAFAPETRPRIGIAAAPVQACWLNRTIRAELDPRVLGDLAADPTVERIDLPRQLKPDQLGSDVALNEARVIHSEQQLTGRGVRVGVIDSEVALGHPGLANRVIHRRNYTQEPFGTPDAHGTAVAGLIAAGGSLFTGMAPGAEIYNYKVLATNAAQHAEDFEAALAIQHALEDGVRVANCSWGAGEASDGSSREARACDAAWRLGLTIVKSAGNKGPGERTLTTPADAEGVIVVGASDGGGKTVPDYSSRGPTADGRERPHLLAPGGSPGGDLTSALVGGGFGPVGMGTSFAAPHVSGLLALLLERDPDLTPGQQRDALVAGCTRISGLSANVQGAGLCSPRRVFPNRA